MTGKYNESGPVVINRPSINEIMDKSSFTFSDYRPKPPDIVSSD